MGGMVSEGPHLLFSKGFGGSAPFALSQQADLSSAL
jgi:hypothetical protein